MRLLLVVEELVHSRVVGVAGLVEFLGVGQFRKIPALLEQVAQFKALGAFLDLEA
jgi:hypothetical protein